MNVIKNNKLNFEHKVALESRNDVKLFWNFVDNKPRSEKGTNQKPDDILANTVLFYIHVLNYTQNLNKYDTTSNSDPNNFVIDINIYQDDVPKKLIKIKDGQVGNFQRNIQYFYPLFITLSQLEKHIFQNLLQDLTIFPVL